MTERGKRLSEVLSDTLKESIQTESMLTILAMAFAEYRLQLPENTRQDTFLVLKNIEEALEHATIVKKNLAACITVEKKPTYL